MLFAKPPAKLALDKGLLSAKLNPLPNVLLVMVLTNLDLWLTDWLPETNAKERDELTLFN
jgi:hypothetical protein